MVQESQFQIPDREVKVEIRRGGQWVQVDAGDLLR